ncbi:MAG: HrpE/YscL family type III secretion apparatus protein [Candidatus Competibacteraceae bacterium]|jgi:type III secretion protein L|nr:HrpE/YscL family type III secretion apparatus protein [Candidatus Competibacteraceae bacterium]
MPIFLRRKSVIPELAPGLRVLKVDAYGEYEQASAVLAQAQRDAAQLREDAETAYAEAKQRGYQDGLAEGQEKASQHIWQLSTATAEYWADLERQLASIIMDGIRRILGEFDQETKALAAISNGLQLLRRDQRVTLRIAPSAEAGLRKRLAELPIDPSLIDIVTDNRLGPEACTLESDIGIVDAGIDSQVNTLERFLEAKLDDQQRLSGPAASIKSVVGCALQPESADPTA